MPESEPLGRVFGTTEELNEPEEAQVVGRIPEWVRGSFLRSGPGVFDLKDDFTLNHVFDGFAVISKFEFKEGGRVTWDKRFLGSEAYQRAAVAGRPCVTEYGTRAYSDPAKSFFSKLIPNLVPPLSDNCNMSIFKIANEVFASSETNYIRPIDPSSLACCGDKVDSAKLYSLAAMSCHPLTDETGTTYNIGISVMTGLKYNVVKIPPPASNQSAKDLLKKSKVICSISSSWNGYLSFNHSFGMTKNYIIIIEQPYVYSAAKVFGGVLTRNMSIKDWLSWKPDFSNTFFIVEKATGRLIKTVFQSADPFFYLHVINAYEEGDSIVLDLSVFPNSNVLESLTVANLRRAEFNEEEQPYGARFVLPMLNIGEAEEGLNLVSGVKTEATAVRVGSKILLSPELLTEKGLEMPTINRRFLGKKYGFYYGTGSATKGVFRNSVVKVELGDRKVGSWRGTESQFVGEPVFIPAPQAVGEDDGVVLSCVTTDGTVPGERDFLLVLDAKTFTEIGRAYIESHMPQGVHGIFLPASAKE